jgi:hypothetical protein
MDFFHRLLLKFQRDQRLELLDDSPVRVDALAQSLAEVGRMNYRNLSLVDQVLRLLIADRTLRIDGFITSNPNDFADVCHKFRRNMLTLTKPI